MACLRLFFILALAAAIITALVKRSSIETLPPKRTRSPNDTRDTAIVLEQGWFVAQLIGMAVFLVALNLVYVPWLWQVHRARQQHRSWTLRRKHLVLESFTKGATLNIMLVAGLAAAACMLARPESLCSNAYALNILFFIYYQVRHVAQCLAVTPTKSQAGLHVTASALSTIRSS